MKLSAIPISQSALLPWRRESSDLPLLRRHRGRFTMQHSHSKPPRDSTSMNSRSCELYLLFVTFFEVFSFRQRCISTYLHRFLSFLSRTHTMQSTIFHFLSVSVHLVISQRMPFLPSLILQSCLQIKIKRKRKKSVEVENHSIPFILLLLSFPTRWICFLTILMRQKDKWVKENDNR